jgi:putative tricarboxylic transport membrane protein
VGAVVAYQAARLPYWQADGSPGPGFLPLWLALSLVGLSVVVLLQAPRADRYPQTAVVGSFRPMLVRLALLAGYVTLAGTLGFAISTFLYLAVSFRQADVGSGRQTIALAALITLGLVLVFPLWLALPLPRGPLGRF